MAAAAEKKKHVEFLNKFTDKAREKAGDGGRRKNSTKGKINRICVTCSLKPFDIFK